MHDPEKVIWSEGMFLRPHHFQQSDRWQEANSRNWGKILCPWYWGFMTLSFDRALLTQGKLSILDASGIFPDGTYFNITDAVNAPPPLLLTDATDSVDVVLALPEQRPGQTEVIFTDDEDSLARYVAQDKDVDDLNASSIGRASLQFGRLRLRLMPASELSAQWTGIGIARVRNNGKDRALTIDPAYVSPLLNVHISPVMSLFLKDMQGLLHQRSEQISERLQRMGPGGLSEMSDFMLLTLINRYIGQVEHCLRLPQLHPERLFSEWLQFATELSSWSLSRRPGEELPEYNHDNLHFCFGRLIALLRQSLSVVTEENVVQVILIERAHGLLVGPVSDTSLLRDYSFVLAVRADIPVEMLMTHFPAQIKIAPVGRIRDLVQFQLPGIGLRIMPAVPRQIPWHSGSIYFELERTGELWQQMTNSEAFALHVSGDFSGLDVQLWALRHVLS